VLTFKEIHIQFKNARSEKDLAGIGKVWEYLAARGISRETADAVGLFVLPAMELIAAARRTPNIRSDSRAAVVFPHYRVADDEAIDWWSSRLVDLDSTDVKPKLVASFGDLVDPSLRKRPGKMFCPPNEYPHGYLVPALSAGLAWGSIPRGARVYIHESCIKAINGAILGKYSVGLNGVWGWASAKHNIALIEELRDLPWKARELVPCIVFDSNVRTNWQVQNAESRLAAKLFEITGRNALAFRVPQTDSELSGAPSQDQGFDDYRKSVGDALALEFLEGEGEVIDVSEIELLRIKLNSEVCVVRDIGRIAEQDTGYLMSRAVFTDVNYAHYTAEITVGDGDKTKIVNVPSLWLSDPRRVEVQALDYMPGYPQIWEDPKSGLSKLNLWRGMGCEPESGLSSPDPWLELLSHNVEDEWLRNWIVGWFAYPLQNPGAKMNTLLLIFGPSGTGKGLFLAPFRSIYGDNAITISSENLKSTFNSVYANKQFIHADELKRVRDEGDSVNQKLKLLVTDEFMVVNTKGQPEYRVRNCANWALTSNYFDCLKLDQDDRRACVVHWSPLSETVDRRGDQEYWIKYVEWLDAGGAASLYQYLLEFDLSGFDPHAWAPATEAKLQVTESAMLPMELWMKDLWTDPDTSLPLVSAGRCLWTAKEIAVLYYGLGEGDLTQGQLKGVSNGLRNQGFQQAAGGAAIRAHGREGAQARYWVIRNRADKRWGQTQQCLVHLKKFF
jgi:putative DNA primase/helicase